MPFGSPTRNFLHVVHEALLSEIGFQLPAFALDAPVRVTLQALASFDFLVHLLEVVPLVLLLADYLVQVWKVSLGFGKELLVELAVAAPSAVLLLPSLSGRCLSPAPALLMALCPHMCRHSAHRDPNLQVLVVLVRRDLDGWHVLE